MKFSELLKKIFRAEQSESRGVAENRVETFDEEVDIDLFNPFPDPVELEIGDVFDLHSIPPREVRVVVEEYLREAHERGFKIVRVIHGKGIGVQREIVRSVLERTPFVEHFADASPEAGGWGATVVFISQHEQVEGK